MIPATTSTPISEPAAPASGGSWLAEFTRLVRWELFLAWRRRAMMITLGSLLLVGYLLALLFQYAIYYSYAGTEGAQIPEGLGQNLSFPGTLSLGGSYVSYVGVLLFVVLAGALIGSEYSYNTLRLSLTRGVGRGRLLAAQIVALALLALAISGGMLLLSGLVGLLGDALGLPQPNNAPGAGLVGEIAIYWLAVAFNAFAYALIALWIGTLSRSVAGAIAGPLVFIVIEVVATEILTALGAISDHSPLLNAIAHLPEYLMGVNTNALMTHAGEAPYAFTQGNALVSAPHAVIVAVVYCTLFIFISYLALRNRDVLE